MNSGVAAVVPNPTTRKEYRVIHRSTGRCYISLVPVNADGRIILSPELRYPVDVLMEYDPESLREEYKEIGTAFQRPIVAERSDGSFEERPLPTRG